VTCVLNHPDGTSEEFLTNQTMSPEHIAWFKAGSALNMIRQELGGE
jgi:aconitate hydratase